MTKITNALIERAEYTLATGVAPDWDEFLEVQGLHGLTICIRSQGEFEFIEKFFHYRAPYVWDNLKDIEYIKVIGQNLLLFLGIIVAIAFVYYIGSLIIKKQPNFGRMLGIAAMGIVPLYISALILAPILNLIWTPLGMVVTVMGGVYSLLMIYETMNDEVALEGNVKYYFISQDHF